MSESISSDHVSCMHIGITQSFGQTNQKKQHMAD